ncbi:hypothetical protein NLG97_g6532 [Lecanicillium saksenae]|uniref:Uncharacterized protein n=1 Tax=Lecanicillium saksenae TaxID=468837 RepID=A0ACC1QR90_9HYPO|nr:hypothetical protein NLG97_g6532 [Lecanicillium saksenae]
MLTNAMRHTRTRQRLSNPLAAAALATTTPTTPSAAASSHRRPMAGRGAATAAGAWRPVSVLDDWVAREARPISLRQLMVFGRSLTESRLISSANYVRTELPSRIAHRLRDMQQLPYVVVTNPHINDVYNLYYNAFDTFRKIKEVKTLEDNDHLCDVISQNLKGHLTVIPKLAMGILECGGLMNPQDLDKFMNTILKSRISRRVIAEQHLSLTETYNSPHFSPGAKLSESDFIGEVDILLVTLADGGDDLLGGGVDDFKLLLVDTLNPLVVDEPGVKTRLAFQAAIDASRPEGPSRACGGD